MPTLLVPLVLTLVAPDESVRSDVLPLRRLRLYETGVGYFERRGRVSGRAELTLPVPTSHLDDALKTLVILGSTSAKVRGIAFATAVSEGMARAIAGLPDEGEGVEYLDLLHSLEGAPVRIETDADALQGRLIDVEGPFGEPQGPVPAGTTIPPGPPPPPQYRLLLLGEDGDLRRVPTQSISSIRPLHDGDASRLDVAAEALSNHTARSRQRLDIQVDGGGPLGLGYIAEAPVWRTSYRVVLGDSTDRGILQGWALVHNDTDEDWNDVAIELVNGRPSSFLYPLAAPRYAWRELVTPTDELSTVPQLATTTPDRMWLDGVDGLGGLGLSGHGRGGGGYGSGSIGVGRMGVIGHGSGGSAGPSIGDLAELSKAKAEPQGALFAYSVEDPVDLDAHHSALLPIVSESIEAESITWFPSTGADGLTGVRLVNSTNQTLPAGTIAFFGGAGFVGEAILDRLGPTERRFVVYGAELDVELERNRHQVGNRTASIEFTEGVLIERLVVTSRIELRIHNRSARPQRAYVALDLERNAELTTRDDAIELDYDRTTATPLAAVTVPAGSTGTHHLHASTGAVARHERLDAVTLEVLAARDGLDPEIHTILRRALEHRRAADEAERTARAADRELEDLEADLGRIRQDLEALGKAQVPGRFRERLSRELLAKEKALVQRRAARRASKQQAATAARKISSVLDALP